MSASRRMSFHYFITYYFIFYHISLYLFIYYWATKSCTTTCVIIGLRLTIHRSAYWANGVWLGVQYSSLVGQWQYVNSTTSMPTCYFLHGIHNLLFNDKIKQVFSIWGKPTYFEWNASKPRKEHAVLCTQALVNVSQTDICNNLSHINSLYFSTLH